MGPGPCRPCRLARRRRGIGSTGGDRHRAGHEQPVRSGCDPRAADGPGRAGADVLESSETEWNNLMASGTYEVAVIWSGSASRSAQNFGLPVEFVVPEEGAIGWFDGLSIPDRCAEPGSGPRVHRFYGRSGRSMSAGTPMSVRRRLPILRPWNNCRTAPSTVTYSAIPAVAATADVHGADGRCPARSVPGACGRKSAPNSPNKRVARVAHRAALTAEPTTTCRSCRRP